MTSDVIRSSRGKGSVFKRPSKLSDLRFITCNPMVVISGDSISL